MISPELGNRIKRSILIAIIVGFVIFTGSLRIGDFFSYILSHSKDQKASVLAAMLEATSSPISFFVDRVVDGDTIDVKVPGGVATIRMIGINTPETLDPRKPVQCFGPEASARGHELLEEQTVLLKRDPSQDTYDKYGRILAYVFLPDGTFYNELMIEGGYAKEYTYHSKYEYQKDFRSAQKQAKKEGRGLWGLCN